MTQDTAYFEHLLKKSYRDFQQSQKPFDAYLTGASLAGLGRSIDAQPFMDFAYKHYFEDLIHDYESLPEKTQTRVIEFLTNYGILLRKLKNYDASYTYLRRAYDYTHHMLALQGLLDVAAEGELKNLPELIEEALQTFGDDPDMLMSVGRAMRKISFEKTKIFYEHIISLYPDKGEMLQEYALYLNDMGYGDTAYELLQQLLQKQPYERDLLINIALVSADCELINETYEHYEQLKKHFPDNANLYMSNYAKFIFRQGKYQEAFKGNELRLKAPDLVANMTPLPIPMWHGEPLQNAHLLILGEQGVGDQISFAVMFPIMQEYALKNHIKVTFTCKEKLETIFAREFSFTIPHKGLLQEHNHIKEWGITHYCYQASLLHFFGLFYRCQPAEKWLNACPSYIEKTTRILDELRPKKIIGLSFKSGTKPSHSLTLNHLRPLAKLDPEKYIFISLQYGDSVEMIEMVKEQIGINIVKVKEVDLFEDMEAVMALTHICDVVIHNSNTNAHIAGAMGKKGYIILPYQAFWRWGYKDTPAIWYKNLQLIREKKRGEFQKVMEYIADDIQQYDHNTIK